jgi:hypothetical protein
MYPREAGRLSSETPSHEGSKGSPASSSGTPNKATNSDPMLHLGGIKGDWSGLPADFQFYLNYFSDSLSQYHYCMVVDPDHFFTRILPTMAVHDEALLHALVGFSAYNLTLRNSKGRLNDFLHYYNRSVNLLLNFLKRREKATVTTLVTILQLATIEVTLPHDGLKLSGLTNDLPAKGVPR